MDVTDRQNWALSALVGVLIAANGVVWAIFWEGWVGRVTGGALAIAGGVATYNAIQAIRNEHGIDPMGWSTQKTLFNVLAILVLFAGLVFNLLSYL